MDLLDRLIGHDVWMTGVLLGRCRELSEAQLDQPLDMDHETVRALLAHMIGNMEVWTELMAGTPIATTPSPNSLDALIERHEEAAAAFASLARRIVDDNRLNDLWTDVLDNPPTRKSYGGAIAHVITHDMHHRAQLLWMLRQLGLQDLPEGDLLGWEMR